MITFSQPWLLLLLLPVGALIYLTWRRMSLPFPPAQRRFILASRLLLFALIIAALAGATWSRPVSRQAVVFVGDISASTGPQRDFMEQWITSAIKHKRSEDQVGIVAVGRNALVEQSVSSQLDFSHFESTPDTNYTDLAAGLRLAAAILPSDSMRHIVLLSDGQQNIGDALQEAQLLQQQGIRLDIVPLPNTSGVEARIDGLDAPTQLRTNERFLLHIKFYSTVTQTATVRVYLDQGLLLQQAFKLTPGQQEATLPLLSPPPGFHTYRVTLDAPQDTILQNNEAAVFVNVQGPPRVLVVEGRQGDGANIVSALKATKISVDIGTPNDIPLTLDGLAPYSTVVLADVPAVSLGTARMQILQSFVRDLGHGLVVSGGQNSYGVGGYANTPLEQTLPVRMDIPQHKDTPSIAVVLIVESLESDVNVNISKEAAKGVINLLSPRDQVGISAAYGKLAIPMQFVTDKNSIDHAIDTMDPADPASYLPDLQNAENELLHTNAKIKHVILLGDGDTGDGYPAQAQVMKMAKENITVSTVATNADNYADLAVMQQLANWGKGRFYRADDPSAIPQVLLRETQQAARRAIINEPFIPAIVGAHPILTGLGPLPGLGGYVATTPKSAAQLVLISHKDDPVLAVWQYGLGRVAAWTSDALGLWTANWLQWNDAARWWANLVTWTLPTPDSSLNINGRVVGASGQLTVDLPAGTSSNATGQQMQARIITPDLSQEVVALQNTAPNRWEGTFPALQVGAYLVQIAWRGTSNGNTNQLSATTGLVVPYSPEYRTQGVDTRFLQLLAQAGGGTLLNPANSTSTFDQNLPPVSADIPIVFWLLILAALLLPIDIAARRLSSLEFFAVGYQWLRTRLKRGQPALANASQTAQAAPGIPLGTLRAKREERQTRLVRPVTPTVVKNTKDTREKQVQQSTTPQAPQKADAAAATVSTSEKLLEAKRRRAEERKK